MAIALARSKRLSLGEIIFKNASRRILSQRIRNITKSFSHTRDWLAKEELALHRAFVNGLEYLRKADGVFIAAPSQDYRAVWIRDQLYCTSAYYFLGDYFNFKKGMWVVFDILNKPHSRARIERSTVTRPEAPHEVIHAKYHPNTL